jgi:hypothetical protein
LLHVSGGALEMSKCNYYAMHWTFQPSGLPKLDPSVKTYLHLVNGDGTATVTLTNDAITVAHKTLGNWKSAARDQVKQIEVLTTKSNEYARTIMASPVNRGDNWTAYYAIYLPRLTFVLHTSYIPDESLKQIEQRAVAATLCKGGFVSTFPRKVAYGPNRYGGIAMRPLTIEQLSLQVQIFIKNLRCPGEGNEHLLITLAWAQMGSGSGFPLLAEPSRSVPQLECKLIQSVRTGLASIEASIESIQNYVIPIRRAADSHVMDAINASRRYTPGQVARINACRLYLEVTLVSDIATPCGRYIHPSCYTGDKQQRINWATIQYPRQNYPDKTSWKQWKTALHEILLKADKFTLRTSLGKWLPAEQVHHHWKWNHDDDFLYYQERKNSKILRYRLQASVRRKFRYFKEGTETPEIPTLSIPVEAEESATHFLVPYTQMFVFPRKTYPNCPDTIRHRINQLPTSLKQLVDNVEVLASDEAIQECFDAQQHIRLASDGGAIPGRASFGWILQVGDVQIAKGKGPAFGDDPRSFRAEGYGMASGLLYLRLIQQTFEFVRTAEAHNTIICDNEGLLTRIQEASTWGHITPNVTLRAEWDIESVILQVYHELSIPFSFLHVYSHQDDAATVDSLPLAVRLNIEADKLATVFMQEDTTRRPIATLFPSAKAQLIIKGKSVTRKLPFAIRYEAGSIGIRKYLKDRNSWTERTLNDIHWDSHGASHSYHRPQRCFLIKLCHRHLPVGKTLYQRNPKYPSTCPGCREELETQSHFLKCNGDSRIAWRVKFITDLRQQMTILHTDTNLQEAILTCLDNSLAGRPNPTRGPFGAALLAQVHIGWTAMFRGYWSLEWQKAYTRTYPVPEEETRKQKNKRHYQMEHWQKKIIQQIWRSLIALWTTRNTERHGWDKESRDGARREVLHHELASIYARKHEYPARVQRLLRASYEIHITETASKLADWLDAYQTTFAMTWSPD